MHRISPGLTAAWNFRSSRSKERFGAEAPQYDSWDRRISERALPTRHQLAGVRLQHQPHLVPGVELQ
jgi:hypothetical protein